MRKSVPILFFVFALAVTALEVANAQTVPMAPTAPTCTMVDGKSNCRFKTEITGTPTSVVGNRVIVFRRANGGGHPSSRDYLDDAVKRLAVRYGFTATISEDPAIFTAANLANTKVVIMSNGDGDVLPPGANRNALQDFQQVNGWGVIWIHAACAFVTSGWPFAQQNCVQLFLDHNPVKTSRRIFIDSGTTASPSHGAKNAQTEFVMRALPGWTPNRTFTVGDEYYCFQAPARNTTGVNVLIGYDRGSGLPPVGKCATPTDASLSGSQNHNLAWTRTMGKGIGIYNSIGHDVETFTSGGNAGDSLLWRFIRYAAKDWELGEAVGVITRAKETIDYAQLSGTLVLEFKELGSHTVSVSDFQGKRVFKNSYSGVNRVEISSLKRGIYFVKVNSGSKSEVKRFQII